MIVSLRSKETLGLKYLQRTLFCEAWTTKDPPVPLFNTLETEASQSLHGSGACFPSR